MAATYNPLTGQYESALGSYGNVSSPYLPTTPTQLYSTPGAPTTGSGTPYGMIPNLPPYTVDTSTTAGENPLEQMGAFDSQIANNLRAQAGVIDFNLKGIPNPQTTNLLRQSAAEYGVGIGAPGSPVGLANFLAKLGLTSAQMQALGATQQNAYNAAFPIQKTSTTTNTTDTGIARAQYAAAPDPALAAAANRNALNRGLGGGMGGFGGIGSMIPTSNRDMSWFYSNPSAASALFPTSPSGGSGGDYIPGNWAYSQWPDMTYAGTTSSEFGDMFNYLNEPDYSLENFGEDWGMWE